VFPPAADRGRALSSSQLPGGPRHGLPLLPLGDRPYWASATEFCTVAAGHTTDTSRCFSTPTLAPVNLSKSGPSCRNRGVIQYSNTFPEVSTVQRVTAPDVIKSRLASVFGCACCLPTVELHWRQNLSTLTQRSAEIPIIPSAGAAWIAQVSEASLYQSMPDRIETVILRSFLAALVSGKREWWLMTAPVLKNRILDATGRSFCEEDHNARTFLEFVSNQSELLHVDMVEEPPMVELSPQRVRRDLWQAITDSEGGIIYQLDPKSGRAVPASEADQAINPLPTIAPEEERSWRQAFVQRARKGDRLSRVDAVALDAWALHSDGSALSGDARRVWDRELHLRVLLRLSVWCQARRAGSKPQEPPDTNQDDDDAEVSVNSEFDALLRERHDIGDFLGVGSLLCKRLVASPESDASVSMPRIIHAWAEPSHSPNHVNSISDLLSEFDELDQSSLAVAAVHLEHRLREGESERPSNLGDLTFRLKSTLENLFKLKTVRSPKQALRMATSHFARLERELEQAVDGLSRATPTAAKSPSIAVVKAARRYREFALPTERPMLRDIDVLLGAAFRKFCESCEQHASLETIRRAAEHQNTVESVVAAHEEVSPHSLLWNNVVQPLTEHVKVLLDRGAQVGRESSKPGLGLVVAEQRVDLGQPDRVTNITCRLRNYGPGRATDIRLKVQPDGLGVEIELAQPQEGFSVGGGSEQLVRFRLTNRRTISQADVPLIWVCSDAAKEAFEFPDTLQLRQQLSNPDWDELLRVPPYTINPIKRREFLFGRDAVLETLLLRVTSGTSSFLWGQKRVGKTSVLQVLASELKDREGVVCILLRMGELASLHEGQIAHTIATRLNGRCPTAIPEPSEEQFGAGLNRLVRFVDDLQEANPDVRLVTIIDEFDDLDHAFYTGERGRQFVKALRSLSEIGLTFFFVGSERMNSIYRRHQSDLNKWVNISLDRIDREEDCRALVARPVEGKIEYEDAAIHKIVDYSRGNPFYMHLCCFETFNWCVKERRTYVSEGDLSQVLSRLRRTLGETNFSHFWEDNPVLDRDERDQQAAENCLVLGCLGSSGGECSSDEVWGLQAAFDLPDVDRMERGRFRIAVERLKQRQVLLADGENQICFALPIFADWISSHAESMVANWRIWLKRSRAPRTETPHSPGVFENSGTFPIEEDELLAVSQRLVYHGKQKDVAEVRRWLRQFDDDNRIEIAFLLLKRLADKGYQTEGSQTRTLTRIEELIESRRLEVGGQAWRIVRGRKDNLCLTFVDSDTKSGAAITREVGKRIRPGKTARHTDVRGWLANHQTQDPLIVVLDDLSCTGSTIVKGLEKLEASVGPDAYGRLLSEGRVSCYLAYAFPEAVDRIRGKYPTLEVIANRVFGDEVRALSPEAAIFDSDDDRSFAQDMLLQIGRELNPQNPLGWGDQGALLLFHNTIPNNTLPVFWSNGRVREKAWHPLFPRA